jgi:phosphoheptose isomerase
MTEPGADAVRAVFDEAVRLHAKVAAEAAPTIARAATIVEQAIGAGRKVLAFGNGGSATDAQHFVAELVGRFGRTVERPGLPALALTADTAVLTSVANDLGFAQVFARQIQALGRGGDVAIALTTSGASPNVNAALAQAREQGLATVALTGGDGGTTGRLAHVHVNVPHADPARVQEVHRTILHAICGLVEERCKGQGAGGRGQGAKGRKKGKGRGKGRSSKEEAGRKT